MKVYPLSAAFIEEAHDVGISEVWPGTEPVRPSSCISPNLLLSCEQQPYMRLYDQECYPTLASKAAYIFCHIATAHLFDNGNKRTAVLCLDTFLLANTRYLTVTNEEMYELACTVAMSGEEGKKFPEVHAAVTRFIEVSTIPLSAFRTTDPSMYRTLHRGKWSTRNHPKNRIGTPLRQRIQ